MRENRGTAAQRGYGARWQRARARYLAQHPLCVPCEDLGRTTAATVVDHVIPHKGDQTLFWDESNWRASCVPCHSGAKQSEERTGRVRGCYEDGSPLGRAW